MIVIQFIIYIFWSVMGLLFWVPILTRVAFSFIGKILYDTISGKPTDVIYINKLINISAEFYFTGFKLINERFKKLSGSEGQPIYEDMKSPFFSHAKNIIWTIIFWSLVLFPLYKDKIFPKLISALTQNDSINGRPLHIKQTKNDVGDQELQNERYQNEYFSYKVYSSLQSEVTGYTYGKDVLRGRNIKITNGLPVVIRSKYLNKMNPLEKTLRINYTVYHQPIKSDVNYIVEFGIYQFRNYKGKEMYKVIASDKYPINISHEYSVDAYKRYGKIQVSGTILDIFPSELERGYYGAYWKYYYPNGEELQIFTSPNKPAIEPVKKQSKWLFILD